MRRRSVVCIALVAAVIGIVLVERFAAFRGARILDYLALFGAAATCAWAASGAWRNALLVVCSLLFGVGVLEGVVLTIAKPKTERRSLATFEDSGLNGPRPILGWGPSKPGPFRVVKRDEDGHIIYDTKVTIDASRNRISTPNGPRPIAFFGDSFVFGDGVADDETLPQAFSALNGGKIPVVNLSFSGWSPAQSLVALQKGLYRSLLDTPRRFILFTSPFHIQRTACKGAWRSGTAPRYFEADGMVRYGGPCAGRYWSNVVHFAERFALYRRIATYFDTPTKADTQTYLAIIKEFVRTAKKTYNVDTTVFYEPTGDNYAASTGYTDDRLVAAMRQQGIDVLVDRLPPIDNPDLYWIPHEGHPTALAYRAMAREIEAHLQKVDPAALQAAL